ncbi:MAG: FtsX-like permease family protein [Jatrophihabitantaceae bacterium]
MPDNFGSGLFGGISLTQYRRIGHIAGVRVAAPVANLGYVLVDVTINVPVNTYLNANAVQLFRVSTDDVAQRGLSSYPGERDYIYYTRANAFSEDRGGGNFKEHTAMGPLDTCDSFASQTQPSGPFDSRDFGQLACFAAKSPRVRSVVSDFPAGMVGVPIVRQYPLLLSAIDPVQEARLVGLDHAITVGRYLQANESARLAPLKLGTTNSHIRTVPVIADSTTYLDDVLHIQIQRFPVLAPAAVPAVLASTRARSYLESLRGQTIAQQARSAGSDYAALLQTYRHAPTEAGIPSFSEYRQAGPIRYQQGPHGLSPESTTNPVSVWNTQLGGFSLVPAANADTAFRKLTLFLGTNRGTDPWPTPTVQIVGQFDPGRLTGQREASRVPLETYFPPQVTGTDAASRAALHDQPLLPDANLAGYLSQPPALLTTLNAAQAFWSTATYANASKSPISYIRVRVAGVSGPDPVSLARLDAVATAIHQQTGLTVDITAGSSPQPQSIALPAGKYGRPALRVSEGWVSKGVAVRFLHAIDQKSLLLFVLVLVVCLFFLTNAAVAAERARRVDLGVLSCLGWSRRCLFGYVLGQQAAIGVLAGIAGTTVAALLTTLLNLRVDPWRLALITPVAVVLACAAGLFAALRAARAEPLKAVAAPVARLRRVRRVRSLFGMAAANVRRMPGRSITGAAALFVAVAALTILLGATIAFQGSLVGSVLGNAVSLQVRGVDYLAVALMLVLADLSLADVVYLNLTERGDEFATLSATGWQIAQLRTLLGLEGLLIAATGSILGAAAGVGVVAIVFPASIGAVGVAAVASAALAIVTSTLVMLIPISQMARRTPATQLVSAE